MLRVFFAPCHCQFVGRSNCSIWQTSISRQTTSVRSYVLLLRRRTSRKSKRNCWVRCSWPYSRILVFAALEMEISAVLAAHFPYLFICTCLLRCSWPMEHDGSEMYGIAKCPSATRNLTATSTQRRVPTCDQSHILLHYLLFIYPLRWSGSCTICTNKHATPTNVSLKIH